MSARCDSRTGRVRCERDAGHVSPHANGPLSWGPGAGWGAPSRAAREGDSQPLPTVNDAPDVQSAVIADIEQRREVGISRYGTALQPNNGRNALLDAYEEALDLACYLKQRLIEEAL